MTAGNIATLGFQTRNIAKPVCNVTANGVSAYQNVVPVSPDGVSTNLGWSIGAITINNTTTYVVTCSSPSGNVTSSVVINIGSANSVTVQGVNGAPTVTITANPLNFVVNQDQAIAINWTSTGATGCLLYDASFAAPLAAGFYMPTTSIMTSYGVSGPSTTYKVTCTNAGSPRGLQTIDGTTTTAQITITATYPTTFSTSAPTTVASGQSVGINLIGTQATYSWHLTTCNVNGSGKCGSTDTGFGIGAGGGGPQGQYYNYTNSNYTVTWTAQALDRSGGVLWTSPTGSIVVTPSTTPQLNVSSMTATPSTITAGGSTTLNWSVVGAIWGCSIVSGNFDSVVARWSTQVDPNNGHITVSPTKTTDYSIVCNRYALTTGAYALGVEVKVN